MFTSAYVCFVLASRHIFEDGQICTQIGGVAASSEQLKIFSQKHQSFKNEK